MSKQETNIDANKVIDYLAQENAIKAKDNAILRATIESLNDVVDKQRDVIKAYEDRDALTGVPSE